MNTKSTGELEKILSNTHPKQIGTYFQEHEDDLVEADHPFSKFIKNCIHEKKLLQREVFLWADIPERYGYKLLSGEKKTQQRDVILRLCYAAQLTLQQTQRALKLYEMPALYAKIPRDALLMTCFSNRPGNIFDVDELLAEQGFETLKTCGLQE
jgi:hypothetical protein